MTLVKLDKIKNYIDKLYENSKKNFDSTSITSGSDLKHYLEGHKNALELVKLYLDNIECSRPSEQNEPLNDTINLKNHSQENYI